MINTDIVIATWGFGPTYRNRVKEQIKEARDCGYDKVMKYLILTDLVSDFDDIDQSLKDLIVDIVDIEILRKDDEFSKKYEPIPEEKLSDEIYAKQLRYQSDILQLLPSYGLQRYSLKRLAELGITKFLFMDSDVQIPYEYIKSGRVTEEEFWSHYEIPKNTIKGSGFETIKYGFLDENLKMEFIYGRTIGSNDSMKVFQSCTAVAYKYFEEIGKLEDFRIIQELSTLEGCFRLYNFESVEKLNEFFTAYNHLYKIFLSNRQLNSTNLCGNYMLCDVVPLALTSLLQNIKLIHFPGTMYVLRVFFADRFWGPPWYYTPHCNGKEMNLLPAKSEKEFLEINSELIECMKCTRQWPNLTYNVT